MAFENPLQTAEFEPDKFEFYEGLTDTQSVYVYWRTLGFTPTQSAKKAGYKQPKRSAQQNEKDPRVREVIAKQNEETRIRHQIDRDRVIDGMLEALSTARLQSDAKTMLAAWSEIARVTGVEAPEVKEIRMKGEITTQVSHKLAQATNQQLLELLGKDRMLDQLDQEPLEAEYEVFDEAEEADFVDAS